jgi:uncharacterized membrane protein YfcA
VLFLSGMMRPFFIGFLAGCFGGLVGLGGGVVMVPLMTGLLKLTQHQAHGTSLIAIIFTGIAGAIAYGLSGASVDVGSAMLLAATAMFTARVGARFANSLPEWKLKRNFGFFMLFVTVLLFVKPFLPTSDAMGAGWLKILTLLLTGFFTGFLSGMMGVGGGTMMVPPMVLLLGFTQHTAQGSSLLAMVPIALVGAYTHFKLGNVMTSLLPGLIPGVVIGTFLAGSFVHYLSQDVLRLLFGAVMIWTSIGYVKVKKPVQPNLVP